MWSFHIGINLMTSSWHNQGYYFFFTVIMLIIVNEVNKNRTLVDKSVITVSNLHLSFWLALFMLLKMFFIVKLKTQSSLLHINRTGNRLALHEQSTLMLSHLNMAYVTKCNGCFPFCHLFIEWAATVDKDDDTVEEEQWCTARKATIRVKKLISIHCIFSISKPCNLCMHTVSLLLK